MGVMRRLGRLLRFADRMMGRRSLVMLGGLLVVARSLAMMLCRRVAEAVGTLSLLRHRLFHVVWSLPSLCIVSSTAMDEPNPWWPLHWVFPHYEPKHPVCGKWVLHMTFFNNVSVRLVILDFAVY